MPAAYLLLSLPVLQSWLLSLVPTGCIVFVGVPWRDMADDGTVDEGRDNFYYVLNNVIEGNHLPCPNSVIPLLPELPQVACREYTLGTCMHCLFILVVPAHAMLESWRLLRLYMCVWFLERVKCLHMADLFIGMFIGMILVHRIL